MKQIFERAKLIAACFLLVVNYSAAQRVQIRQGTELTYQVEDWGRKYMYIVTIDALSDSLHQLQWKTSGKTIYKGTSINEYVDAENADRVLVKPNMESIENLDEYTFRLALPAMMNDEIENAVDTLEYGIGIAADAMLAWRSNGSKIKSIIYNGSKTNFEYRHYTDVNLGITIGFMPYGARNWWIYNYKDEGYSMQLVQIKTPAEKPQTPTPQADTLILGNSNDPIPQ